MNKSLQQLFRVVLLLGIFLSSTVLAGGTLVKGTRIWVSPDYTRVVFDVSNQADYHLFTLHNPERVVIDIKDGKWSSLSDHTLEPKGFVQDLRSGKKSDGLRLVLDAKEKVKPKSFRLKPNETYGHRLVVDLYPQQQGPAKAVKSAKQTSKYRDVVIAIDAGHGGEDPGATGRRGTKEKHITLAVARKLADQINAQKGMKAVLIRDGDYYLKLRQRIKKARRLKADLFLSLHADAFTSPNVKGSSVYILSERGASSEAAKWLANKENSSDELMGGVELSDKDDLLKSVLLDLSQSATIEASADLAQNTLKELRHVGKVHRRHVERAGFAVLKSPDIPSVLIELAFISNPTEEKNLNSRKHQQKMASAITSGLKRYLRRRPPDNTLFAARHKSRSYTIQRGDTLSELAQRYQISSSELKDHNGLKSDILRIGQVLMIPGTGT
jgi:N-acetylmuramoyl-L-alanine amidase